MDALELAEEAKYQNIIDMAVGFTATLPLFQERSADLIKEKLTNLFEGLDRISSVAYGIENHRNLDWEKIDFRSFKENLKGEIKLDKLEQKLVNTIGEPPELWRLDKTFKINLKRRYYHGRKTDLQRIGTKKQAA